MGLRELEEEAKQFDEEMERMTTTPPITDTAPVIAEPAPVVAVEPAPVADHKTEYDKLKAEYDKLLHSHSVLQGKTYAEVPRLNTTNKELKAKITELEAQVQELSANAPRPATPTGSTVVTDVAIAKLKEEFGDDFGETIQSIVNPLKEQIALLETQVKSASSASVAAPVMEDPVQKFYTDLTVVVPDWPAINGSQEMNIPVDPRWYPFLATIDPSSGAAQDTYQDRLNYYFEKGNVKGTAAIFNAFKKSSGIPIAKPVASVDPLSEHVDPGSTGNANNVVKPKPTYTQAEISEAYRKRGASLAAGKATMTEAQWEALDTEYSLAIAEGRVVVA